MWISFLFLKYFKLSDHNLRLFSMFLECDGNMYGVNCTEKCGSCFNFEQCHHLDGTCMKGCDRGFHGSRCIEGYST